MSKQLSLPFPKSNESSAFSRMPASPDSPLPRMMCIKTLSALSSA